MNPLASGRANLSSELSRVIRQRIVESVFAPGERINEVHLADALRVSRTPLREALSQLTAEGLLECRPRRGFFTRALSVAEVEQLYPIRAILDPKALRLAGIPGKNRISILRQINERIAAVKNKPARAIDLDDQWHRALLGGCPNRVLLDLIDQLIWKTRRYEFAYLSQETNIRVAAGEHEAILVALEAADLADACRLLKRNMTSAMGPLIAWLRQRAE